MRKFIHVFFSCTVLLLSIFVLSSCKSTTENMKTIKSKNELLSLLEKYNSSYYYGFPEADNATGDSPAKSSRDYSKTNTQVEGVDEADVVKTDGTFIYLTQHNKVVIAKSYPANELSIHKEITYDNNFYPSLLYVDDNYLVVIGNQYNYNSSDMQNRIWYYYSPTSRIYVYDKTNYDTPKDIIDIDGYVSTSRKVDNNLIVLTSKYLNYSYYKEGNTEPEIMLPYYSINNVKTQMDYTDIHYQENTYPGEFVSVFNFDLSNLTNTHFFTYLGSSSSVYVSTDNIYIAQNIYNYHAFTDTTAPNNVDETKSVVTKLPYTTSAFGASKSTEVKGHVLNQYSMDEYNGTFRIATTQGFTWNNNSTNNVYIFDQDLNQMGSVENLAKGESIQSVRFMGDRIYVVTFRQIDPFFVIDATNPRDPKVLGELKIPGYSTYLHPYDENHVIGFGFETATFNEDGREFTRIIGLKMSLFDVTNPTNPVEKAKEILPFGENGYSYSELTYNPKALLFSKSKNLIAFPLTFTEYKNVEVEGGYGYQYLYRQSFKVFHVDMNGFTYKTDITHYDTSKVDQYRYGYEIMRGIYIENDLYTVSQAKIEVHSLTDFSQVNELNLNFNEDYYYGYPGYYID